MAGHHLLRFSSTTQAVVALSSGESEFYAILCTSNGTRLGSRTETENQVRCSGRCRHRESSRVWPCHALPHPSLDATSCSGGSGHVEESRRRRESRGFENETSRWALLGDMEIVKMTRRSEPSLRVSGETMASAAARSLHNTRFRTC